jgi:hypothetical protein
MLTTSNNKINMRAAKQANEDKQNKQMIATVALSFVDTNPYVG